MKLLQDWKPHFMQLTKEYSMVGKNLQPNKLPYASYIFPTKEFGKGESKYKTK